MRNLRRFVPRGKSLPSWGVLVCEATLVVAAAGTTGALIHVLTSDAYLVARATPLLAMATAGLAALAALACAIIARLRAGDRMLGTVATAWIFYALVVMPLNVTRAAGPGLALHAAAFAAATAFLVLLALAVTGTHLRWMSGIRGFVAAAAFTGVTGGAAVLLPGPATAAFSSAAPDVAIGIGWLLLACGYTLRGWHARDPFSWRVGLGLGVVAAAHLNRLAFDAPGPRFVALRLLGLLVLAIGLTVYTYGVGRGMRTERGRRDEEAATAAHAYARRDHEIRNALANLAALPQVMSSAEPDAGTGGAGLPERGEMVGMLAAELARLSNLLDARPAPPHEDTAPVDLVLTRLVTLRRAAGTQITVDCPAELLAGIPTATLTQVVTNLLANCDRYAPGSPVHVAAERRDTRCVVTVTDAGPGPATDAGPPLGSGIGLALTAQLLTQHDGTLALLPAGDGKPGCTARVELPCTPRIRYLTVVPGGAAGASEQVAS